MYLQSKGIAVSGFVVNDHFADKIPRVLALSKVTALDNMNLVFGLECGYSKWFYKKIEQIQKAMSECTNSNFFVFSDYWLVEQGILFLNHETMDVEFIKNHFNEFQQTYEWLADEHSKNVMTEYLYTSVCHDASKLAELGFGWNYDYDLELLFRNGRDGFVVECGAFDGKSIEGISEYTKNKFEMFALECDEKNYKICCERVKSFPNIKVLKLGAWDKKTKLAIVQLNTASSYLKEVEDESGYENVVEVTDVDSLSGAKGISALIMDIEGSELKALAGAKNAIRNGANLAVRVYHKKEDLITIPQFIQKLNSNYKFYLRFERGANQCRTAVETTMYAVCE